MELSIVKYIKKHGLDKTIRDFKLKTRLYENKILLKYDQLVSPTLMALPEMQDCRGLILELGTWNVMSLAFRKFFNSEEGNAHKIDWNTTKVLEKVDGTLIQVYYDRFADKCTTGTAEGEGEVNNKMGTTFNYLFWSTMDKYGLEVKQLSKDFCYIFELTTPYNIVVKPHGESSVTLLTIRNLETLEEIGYNELVNVADILNVPLVKSYDLNKGNMGAILRTFEDMPWSEEGYVVVDGNFNRVKVKNPAYVAVHHLKGKSAEHNILTIVKSNEIEEFGATFPERREELYKLKENYDKLVLKLNTIWDELKLHKPKNIQPSEKKRFAGAVFEVCKKHDIQNFTGLYFGLAENKISSVEDFMFKYDDKLLYNLL
jgi:T4 RnlA family RNA ligase